MPRFGQVDVIGVSSVSVRPPNDLVVIGGRRRLGTADAPRPTSMDTLSGAAADAYGLEQEYPFFTVVGADGTVKLRASGPKTPDEIEALVTEALER